MILKGYHGTSEESGNQILKEQNIIESAKEDEWLGKGRYFFWDQYDAEWWCLARFDNPFIVCADIKVDDDHVLDLVHNRLDQLLFSQYCEKVKNKSEYRTDGKKRQNYDSLAMSICRKEALKQGNPIQLSLAMFEENNKFWDKLGRITFENGMSKKFPVLIGQIQICVYDKQCITKLYRGEIK